MGSGQFEPDRSRVTVGYISGNNYWIRHELDTNSSWDWLAKLFLSIKNYIQALTQLAVKLGNNLKFAGRNHVLVSWTIGNLSYETAVTFQNHRKWIWWIEHTGLPNAWKAGKGYVLYWVGQAEKFTTQWAYFLERYLENYANGLYNDMRRRLYQAEVALEALAQSYYERNRVYIGQVLQEAQAAANAAFNNSVAYTNKVRHQLLDYANYVLKQSHEYTDKQAKAAHDSAVKDADAFTTAAIAALVAGVIASILAQQAELATAEAADAAWIAGEGALLLEELGQFGHDLSKILDVAFLASMAAYVGFAVTDPKGTGDVTADIIRPITLPILDATKTLLGL